MPLNKILGYDLRQIVVEEFVLNFEVASAGFYLIKVAARAGAWWQQLPISEGKHWLDEELKCFLDERPIEPHFNGNSLYGTRQVIILFEELLPGSHALKFEAKGKPLLEAFEVDEITDADRPFDLTPLVGNRPEDTLLSGFVSRKKSWITLISSRRPFLYLLVAAQARNGRQLLFWQTDDEDLQLKLASEVQKNSDPRSHPFWYWCGRASGGAGKIYESSFTDQNPLLRIDILADRSPNISQLLVSFGRVPTATDPRWTGSFGDDTDVLLLARLIFGEAENQPKDAKIGVGFTVLNRLKKERSHWGYSLREVILKEYQYDGLWNKNTYDKVRDPLGAAGEKRKQEWRESYEVAGAILSHKVTDTTFGSTNFHSYADVKEFPDWATDKDYRAKLGEIYFYELER